MKSYEETVKQLNAKIPRDAIAQRQAGGGVTLDYLEGWYVINRLNEVFGNTRWQDQVEVKVEKEYENDRGKTVVVCSAKHTLTVPNGKDKDKSLWSNASEYEDVGVCVGTGRDFASAYEMAYKGAVTDALKRNARKLGWSMGLALYDKAGEMVEEQASKPASPKTSASKKTRSKTPSPTGQDIGLVIQQSAKVALHKGVLTKEQITKHLKEKFNAEAAKDLTIPQSREFLRFLSAAIS